MKTTEKILVIILIILTIVFPIWYSNVCYKEYLETNRIKNENDSLKKLKINLEIELLKNQLK